MEKAETIAINEHKSTTIAVISGVGTRNYYRKLGYELEGPYMVKSLVPGEYSSVFACVDGENLVKPVKQHFVKRRTLSDEEWFSKYDRDNGREKW